MSTWISVDTEKIQAFLSDYKFPLILSAGGITLLILSIVTALKFTAGKSDIVFSAAESSSSALLETKITVDIEGAVHKPGVYAFTSGQRISDAFDAAGGLQEQADLEWIAKNMNKAAKLADGGKIYVPAVGEDNQESHSVKASRDGQSSTGTLLGVSIGKVNINTATSDQLEALPGIGEATTGKIIAGRPYQSIEQLREKKVIGPSTLEKLRDLIVAE